MLRKLLFWSFTVVFPLPLVVTYDYLATEPGPLKFYIFLGLIAYAWWLLSILLSVRPYWLDRFVGLPSILRPAWDARRAGDRRGLSAP
jgi:hypothetical protein